MAITGPSYKCLYADVGTNGRVNDGDVWNKFGFSKVLENQELSIPNPRCLLSGVQGTSFVLIGNDAFALESHIMKPYPQQNLTTERRVYHYRHRRGRRISENLFGILAKRWCIYHTIMLLEPTAVESVILVTLALHIMLMTSSTENIYYPAGLWDTEDVNRELTLGLWRNDNCADSMFFLEKLTRDHNAPITAKEIRDTYSEYFMNEGANQWQWDRY